MKLYKYRSNDLLSRDLPTLTHNKIYLSTLDGLNDPTEGIVKDEEIYAKMDMSVEEAMLFDGAVKIVKHWKGVFKERGIFSLSKSVKKELMWAYYSNSHYGYCIEYDKDILCRSLFGEATNHEVKYVDEIPELRPDNLDIEIANNNGFMLPLLLGTKSNSWSHEEEYRIVSASSGIKEINPESITGIYFGIRMIESDKQSIRDALKDHDVKFYQMKLIPYTYCLDFDPIV